MKRKRKKKSILLPYALIFVLLGIGGFYLLDKYKHPPAPKKIQSLPASFLSHGIDVSHHQGEINWDQFFMDPNNPVCFVYCKATEGVHFVDSQWKRNKQILDQKKVINGAYHFFLPHLNATDQAAHFLRHYPVQQNDLPPVLDAEVEDKSDDSLIYKMKIWLLEIEKRTGKRPLIYTSYNFYAKKFKGQFEGYKFWIASYSKNEKRLLDEDIICWQYSDNGRLPGIEKPVDLNFSKIRF